MRLCSLSELKLGMRIARDISDERLELLIAAGFEVTERVITRLMDLGVDDVYIEEPGTEDIVAEPEAISDKTRRHTHKLLKRAFDDVANLAVYQEIANEDIITILQYDSRYANAISVPEFHEAVHRTIDDLFTHHVEMFETPMVKTYLNRSYEHALNTAILSVMIGRSFGYGQEELLSLGTAAMLHDVGKLMLPGLSGKTLRDMSLEERRMSKLHPAAGAMIVARSSNDTGLEQASIRQHHEQQDGRGFPLKLTGDNEPPIRTRQRRADQMFRHAEILCVANAFDNLINGDLVVDAMTAASATETLVRGAGTLYNRSVVSKALEIINVYPVGALVEVTTGNSLFNSGNRGVVRRAGGQRMHKPEILILWDKSGNRLAAPLVLDLNQHPGLEVELL
jgi:HD-GYP domain-containing protein (c-di-GMP phosphodiesterase class II)